MVETSSPFGQNDSRNKYSSIMTVGTSIEPSSPPPPPPHQLTIGCMCILTDKTSTVQISAPTPWRGFAQARPTIAITEFFQWCQCHVLTRIIHYHHTYNRIPPVMPMPHRDIDSHNTILATAGMYNSILPATSMPHRERLTYSSRSSWIVLPQIL